MFFFNERNKFPLLFNLCVLFFCFCGRLQKNSDLFQRDFVCFIMRNIIDMIYLLNFVSLYRRIHFEHFSFEFL